MTKVIANDSDEYRFHAVASVSSPGVKMVDSVI